MYNECVKMPRRAIIHFPTVIFASPFFCATVAPQAALAQGLLLEERGYFDLASHCKGTRRVLPIDIFAKLCLYFQNNLLCYLTSAGVNRISRDMHNILVISHCREKGERIYAKANLLYTCKCCNKSEILLEIHMFNY
jgi:hypothetical protein